MDEAPSDPIPEEVLEAFGFAGAQTSRFEHGVMNRHWLVALDERRCVIGRYHRFRSRPAIEWEQSLVDYAGTRGWPVARALASREGSRIIEHDGRLWTAAPYLEGELAPVDSVAAFNIRGRLLGRLHRDLAGFEQEGQRSDAGKTWELDLFVGPAEAGSFNDLLAAFSRDYPELATLIRRQRYRNLRDLSRLKYPDLTDLPIHGDFGNWNLLWKGGQLTGLVDFDQCRRDALLCDVAPLLMPFMPLEARLASALIEGYQSVRPLSDSEWALLPSLVRAALLRWVAFLLVGWRMEGGEPDGIARTMTVRFPAFDTAEHALRALRTTLGR